MKESLERIVTWIKAHPYIAGLIGVVFIVVVYLAIKNKGSGGGGGGDLGSGGDQPSDQLGNLASSGAGSTTSDQPLPGSTDSGSGGSGSSGTGAGDGAGSGAGNFGGLQNPIDQVAAHTGSYALSTGSPISSQSMDSIHYDSFTQQEADNNDGSTLGKASSGIKSNQTSKLGKASSGKKTDTKQVQKASMPNAQKSMSPYRQIDYTQGHAAPAPVAAIGKASGGSTQNKTPAMLVGKGRNFTGFYNGIWYVLGYPTFNNQAPAKAGGGSAKKK
jgi:hypothetical protein